MHDNSLRFPGVGHFVPSDFTFWFGRDPWHPGFEGTLNSWVLNFGEGAYKESNYGEDELPNLNFGYSAGMDIAPHKTGWSPEEVDEVKDSMWDSGEAAYEIEMEDDDDGTLNGITEYGYGFWSKFLWNGKHKLINKPDWMGVSRLTY